jgi:hypothetical protein
MVGEVYARNLSTFPDWSANANLRRSCSTGRIATLAPLNEDGGSGIEAVDKILAGRLHNRPSGRLTERVGEPARTGVPASRAVQARLGQGGGEPGAVLRPQGAPA